MVADHDFNRRMVRTVVVTMAAALATWALYVARDAVLLIYVSALIAMGFSPLVNVLSGPRSNPAQGRVPRAVAIAVVYFTIVAAAVLIALSVVPPLIDQAERLWAALPEQVNALQTFLIRHRLMTHRVSLLEAVQNAPAGTTGNTVNTVLVAVWSVIGGVFGVITVLILSFYLLIEAESLFNYVVRFVPRSRQARAVKASREIVVKVSAWLRAQVLLAGVMGVFVTVGLAAMHVPYFYVVGLIAAVGETVPVLGPIVAGLTAVAIALSVSARLAVGVGIYFLVLHELEANVLVPKIMERRVGVSAVTVIIALLIGGSLWGLVGAVLAIPTAAILSVVVEEFASTADPVETAAGRP